MKPLSAASNAPPNMNSPLQDEPSAKTNGNDETNSPWPSGQLDEELEAAHAQLLSINALVNEALKHAEGRLAAKGRMHGPERAVIKLHANRLKNHSEAMAQRVLELGLPFFGRLLAPADSPSVGKTQVLVSLLDDIRAGRYKQGIKRKDRPNSILLIGHRQTLLREAAAKLGLHCYLDQPTESEGMRTLAVCLDSLPKYNEPYVERYDGTRPIFKRDPPFDLVIIDEVEQVLGHLLSDTLQQRRGIERCFDALLYEVANAKAVIGLDADLGLVTAHAMRTMRPADWETRCRIVYNAPVVPKMKRTLRLFKGKKALEQELIDTVRKGQRCFVTSNSKKLVDTVYKMILNECGADVSVRKITSENSRDAVEIQFVKDIKTEILNVQVLICSPSLGTGIDITFPDGECRVDRVFGFFYSFVNTHTDIDQQLSRVRNPGVVDVWINEGGFNFTSNVDVVMDDLARAYTHCPYINRYTSAGCPDRRRACASHPTPRVGPDSSGGPAWRLLLSAAPADAR